MAGACETRKLMREAIGFHIEGLHLNGDPIPPPALLVEDVEVTV